MLTQLTTTGCKGREALLSGWAIRMVSRTEGELVQTGQYVIKKQVYNKLVFITSVNIWWKILHFLHQSWLVLNTISTYLFQFQVWAMSEWVQPFHQVYPALCSLSWDRSPKTPTLRWWCFRQNPILIITSVLEASFYSIVCSLCHIPVSASTSSPFVPPELAPLLSQTFSIIG